MDLYQKYVEEREGAHVIFNDDVFIKYSYTNTNDLYIEDIFVVPSKRKTRIGAEFADGLCEQSKVLKGSKLVYGSVDLNAKGRDISIKTLYGWGMVISHYESNMIYFVKEII